MPDAPSLFDPIDLGPSTLSNRIAMAPMTRSRADVMGRMPEYAATYYAQRATSGLIITEGIQPSFEGQGYCRTPGLHTDEQVAAWKRVTDAVHGRGGRIFAQIMHVGRITHPLNRQTDAQPVAPSAIAPETTQMWTDQEGMQPIPTPRALETGEIPSIIEEYVGAARLAIEAGFDGVELHAASGYLPNQFLASGTNHRTDQYGGSVENRIRLVLELLEAMGSAIGGGRVGMKISPAMGFNECKDDDPVGLYTTLVQALSGIPMAYLHVGKFTADFDVFATLRPLYDGVFLAGGGLRDAGQGQALLDQGLADVTVWGTLLLSNPDLVHRLRENAGFNEVDASTFYTPGEAGYTDYPALGDG